MGTEICSKNLRQFILLIFHCTSCPIIYLPDFTELFKSESRSQWPRGLGSGSAAAPVGLASSNPAGGMDVC
jgi:hypothetical protein